MILQLSIFAPNRPGELMKVTSVMAERQINCLSVTTYDASDFGVFNLIVEQPEELKEALEAKGYFVLAKKVIAVAMQDTPGYMNRVLAEMSRANINIDCVYTFISKKYNQAVMVFRADDADVVEMFLEGKGHRVFKTLEELTE